MEMNITKNRSAGLDTIDWQLIKVIETGIPYSQRPYLDIANATGISETEVRERLHSLRQSGIIKRFGVIVRHHELGYRANAMVVWDIPDQHVAGFANRLIASDVVHLCYRRPRKLPLWPYNLFCMVHGKDRDTVMQQVEKLASHYPHGVPEYNILFSKRRFRQRGMRYSSAQAVNNHDSTGKLACG